MNTAPRTSPERTARLQRMAQQLVALEGELARTGTSEPPRDALGMVEQLLAEASDDQLSTVARREKLNRARSLLRAEAEKGGAY